MDNNFDDLFNEFFKNNESENKNFDEAKTDNIKKLMDMLNDFGHVSDYNSPTELDAKLGEPDKVESFEEDGFQFEKRIWYVPGGEIVCVAMLDIPLNEKPTKVKTLDEQLEEAIENEDYEIAANIRDAIKKEKKIKKKS